MSLLQESPCVEAPTGAIAPPCINHQQQCLSETLIGDRESNKSIYWITAGAERDAGGCSRVNRPAADQNSATRIWPQTAARFETAKGISPLKHNPIAAFSTPMIKHSWTGGLQDTSWALCDIEGSTACGLRKANSCKSAKHTINCIPASTSSQSPPTRQKNVLCTLNFIYEPNPLIICPSISLLHVFFPQLYFLFYCISLQHLWYIRRLCLPASQCRP